jgi:hypothetical protein
MNVNTATLSRRAVQLLLVAFVLLVPSVTKGQTSVPDFTFSARDKIKLGKRRIRHKVVLRIKDLNPIRYDYFSKGERIGVSEPVDLSKLPFLPPIPSSGAAPAGAATSQGAQSSTIDAEIAAAQKEITAMKQKIAEDKTKISTQQDSIRHARSTAKRNDLSLKLIDLQNDLEADQKALDQLNKRLGDLLKKKALEGITASFNNIRARYGRTENDVSGQTGVEQKAITVRNGVETAKREVNAFIKKSNSDTVAGLLAGVDTMIAMITAAIPPDARWPDPEIARIKTDLRSIQSELESLPIQFPDNWSDWIKDTANATAFKALGDRVKALTTYLDTLKPIRDEWDKQVASLIEVRRFLTTIHNQGQQAFTRTLDPFECDSDVNNTPITLTIIDTTGVDDKETIELVTFQCGSPLSVSTGIAFSTRNEDEFSLINQVRPGTGGGAPTLEQFKVIGSDKRSRFRPIPVLLLNTRIHDFSSDLSLHFSFGAGVDVKTGKTGSDLEFLLGPSLLLKEKFFFTVGTHIGREIRLQDGFSLGQAVPNDLATVPTFKRYTAGLGIAFSYRLK